MAAAAFVSGLVLVGSAPVASAAGNGLYSISPATAAGQNQRTYFNYLVSPGSTISDAVQAYNETTQALPVRLYPADAINGQGGGFALLTPNKTMHTVGKWTSISDLEFTLPPRSVATLPIDINIPGTMSPGDYAGGVVLRPVYPAIEKRHNLTFAIYQAVGTRIYIRVKGPLDPSVHVTHLAIDPQTSISGLFGGPTGADVTYTIKNTGNEILNPTTYLKVSPLIGSGPAGTQQFSSLLPGNSVTITRHINSIEPVLRLSANLSVTDSKPAAATATGGATAWVIPWLLILVIVLLIALYWYLRRRRRRGTEEEVPAEGEPKAPAPVGAANK